jgi:hypothetical protein
LGASLLCLGYLFKNWRRTSSHLITTVFTLLISTYNIVVFGMRTATVIGMVTLLMCPSMANVAEEFTFHFVTPGAVLQLNGGPLGVALSPIYGNLSISVIPAFLWISDAFLVGASLLR